MISGNFSLSLKICEADVHIFCMVFAMHGHICTLYICVSNLSNCYVASEDREPSHVVLHMSAICLCIAMQYLKDCTRLSAASASSVSNLCISYILSSPKILGSVNCLIYVSVFKLAIPASSTLYRVHLRKTARGWSHCWPPPFQISASLILVLGSENCHVGTFVCIFCNTLLTAPKTVRGWEYHLSPPFQISVSPISFSYVIVIMYIYECLYIVCMCDSIVCNTLYKVHS